jgi:hypothetical protein
LLSHLKILQYYRKVSKICCHIWTCFSIIYKCPHLPPRFAVTIEKCFIHVYNCPDLSLRFAITFENALLVPIVNVTEWLDLQNLQSFSNWKMLHPCIQLPRSVTKICCHIWKCFTGTNCQCNWLIGSTKSPIIFNFFWSIFLLQLLFKDSMHRYLKMFSTHVPSTSI